MRSAPDRFAGVLVMAGGLGTRLGELTSTTPKPMLPLDGRPILQYMLEHLRDQGVRHVFLAVRHLSHAVMDYFGDGRWLGVDVEYVMEDHPLDTAGAIGLVPVSSAPLLVVNGDLLAAIPCATLLGAHLGRRAAMTVCHVEHRMQIPSVSFIAPTGKTCCVWRRSRVPGSLLWQGSTSSRPGWRELCQQDSPCACPTSSQPLFGRVGPSRDSDSPAHGSTSARPRPTARR